MDKLSNRGELNLYKPWNRESRTFASIRQVRDAWIEI